MRITIDIDVCVAAGQCVLVADEVFDQSDNDGTALLLHSEPPERLHDAVRQAALVCPTSAIRVHE